LKIKVTMADGKEIVGEREMLDTFMDGWSNTLIHNYKKYDLNGAEIGSGKKIKLSNKWIVSEEGIS
jgi:hypothetical protein